tara:strand:+ start:121 stop:609 length:489 start_codon:yes stop_codon:yes gene_type:complete
MNNRTIAQWDEQSALTNARKIKLNDGHSLSVQASAHHYCAPREDNAEYYTACEVWLELPNGEWAWEEPEAFMPCADIMKLITEHGGILEGTPPPMMPHMSLTAAQIRAKYLGVSGDDEEMTEHFFEDLYKEAPYLKDANPQEVLDLYKAGLLNVFEEMGGWW